MDALVAEDVGRRYGDIVALDGVSLRVEAGDIFSLVGPNGAGKTTLVRALTGTTDASGTVEVLGEPPREVARERVGLLPQDFTPPERLTARELLAFYGGLYDDARPPADLLDTVGLDGVAADTHYEDLSGGQQRRTCVGTALVNDPDVLFLDEPTTGIDPAGRRALWTVLEDLADGGTTIFLTTHDMAEAERLADRVGLLAEGELLAVDTPASLIQTYGGEQLLRIATAGAEEGDLPPLDYDADLVDGQLTVRNVPPTAIGDVVADLEAAGVGYGELTWAEPDLEDVYLALAGEDATPDRFRTGRRAGASAGEAGGESA
jgi:ABC-2 type transport system ATP-binding protein